MELDLKNMLGLAAGGEHCHRDSLEGAGGTPHVAFPLPDAGGCSAPQRKLALPLADMELKEEFDTETPSDKLFDESCLLKRTVSFRCPNETFL